MSAIYFNKQYPMWLTIDVEELTDTNFALRTKRPVQLEYETLIDRWLELCAEADYRSTCFILGSFTEKFPKLVKKLHENGHEIASHGNDHRLVYEMGLEEWKHSIADSKKRLEDLTGAEVKGYRSASWSLPFEKQYYETLLECGYKYSSSYFPMKTYMYGNTIDKKTPFYITTSHGKILEIPVLKQGIPFSGGFYLRVLPLAILQQLFNSTIHKGHKPVLYIHPYEMTEKNMMRYFSEYYGINLDFLLAFFSTSAPVDKIRKILKGRG